MLKKVLIAIAIILVIFLASCDDPLTGPETECRLVVGEPNPITHIATTTTECH